jgi:uncharacterized protein (DUF1778 family)
MHTIRAMLCGSGVLLLLASSGCKRSSANDERSNTSSLIFDSASPEAQQALATPVDFRLTEDNFAEWEAAQRNLDALPRSALPTGGSAGGNPVDRAVERLESSPRARTAIERTGLTVRDFVLETIALAQATEAVSAANSSSMARVPAENLQFVQSHRSRVLVARRQREASAADEQTNSASQDLATPTVDDAERDESSTPVPPTAATPEANPPRPAEERDTAPPTQSRPPVHDSARDTIPPPC